MTNSMTGNSLRAEATRFFDWCRFNLNQCVEGLDPLDKERFRSGTLPDKLLRSVRAAWSRNLQSELPWDEYADVIRRALPDRSDYEAYMNCPAGQEQSLPGRIPRAVTKEGRRRLKEIHAEFFANAGEERLTSYLQVWMSQARALNTLIIQARGYRRKAGGGASIGPTEIDIERMMLSEAEAAGSAMKVRGLLPFIRSLWEAEKTVIVKTAGSNSQSTSADWASGLERKIIPNPHKSEARLNRFLIKLGRALAATEKRRTLPDWGHMDQTIRFVVEGWCESIIVDGERWPHLCLLTTPALARFLTLCAPRRWGRERDPRTLERAITRLGLIRIPKGRIQRVEKRFGQFRFS